MLDPGPRFDGAEIGLDAEILDAGLRQRDRQGGAEHRDVHLTQQETQGPDVVLVAVGEQDALQILGAIEHSGEVGQHQVDAEHVLLGKHETGVDHRQPIVEFDRRAIPADLAEAAQECDANGHPSSEETPRDSVTR